MDLGFANLCGEVASKYCFSIIYAGKFSLVRKTKFGFLLQFNATGKLFDKDVWDSHPFQQPVMEF